MLYCSHRGEERAAVHLGGRALPWASFSFCSSSPSKDLGRNQQLGAKSPILSAVSSRAVYAETFGKHRLGLITA